MIRLLILSLSLGLACGFVNSETKDLFDEALQREIDSETSESAQSTVQVVRPLTFGAAVHAEVQRLQSLQDVFPPRDLSLFTPYGDRTIISVRFPSIPKELLRKANKAGYGYDHSDTNSNQYGPPEDKYGSPRPQYGPPKQLPNKSSGDLGVIISQNFIHRENIRDFFNFARLNQTIPSSELVIDLAKAFAERINTESFSDFPLGGRFGGNSASRDPSFVIVSIESRMRSSPESGRFGFVRGGGFTNGTIIFPSPSNPSVLTNIPFILRNSNDIDRVFDGHQSSSGGLIPLEKTEIKNFLRLLSGINEDIHEEGRQQIDTLRVLSSRLDRPRLPNISEFEADDLFDREAAARLTNWLYTSTVGIRMLSSAPSDGNDDYPAYGPPRTENANSYGPPKVEKVHSYGPPRTDNANSYGPPKVEKVKSYGPPKIEKANSYGPPRTDNANSYGPPKIEKANSYGPTRTDNANSYGPLRPDKTNSYEKQSPPPLPSNIYETLASAPFII